jgi:sugar lactone lactonase YvrE
MKKQIIAFALSLILSGLLNGAQAQIISTIAGISGTGTYTGEGLAASGATFNHPTSAYVDASNNIFITDVNNQCVRRINTIGIINKIGGVVGSSGFSGDGGLANAAMMSDPTGVVTDAFGDVLIVDRLNNRIRKITPFGIMSTYAGSAGIGLGDGGPATNATLNDPRGIAIDFYGNVFVADFGNRRIRKINPSGIITTIAGCPSCSFGDGISAVLTDIGNPRAIALDGGGNLYFTDGFYNKVRKINPAGIISTVAGNGSATLSGDGGPAVAAGIDPYGIASDLAGNLFVADYSNQRIRKINLSGMIRTFAGGGSFGMIDGVSATNSAFANPYGISINSTGDLFVSDITAGRIRKITIGELLPAFVGGASQSLVICENSLSNSLDALLAVIDSNMGQLLTWSVATAPLYGTAMASTTLTATGGVVTPTGTSYTPPPGFSGTDVFVVEVTDGATTVSTTINVTINPLPDTGIIVGPSSVCTGAGIALTDASPGGIWSVRNTHASVSGTGAVTGLTAGLDTVVYTVSNSCATFFTTHVVTVNAAPSIPPITGVFSVCETHSTYLYNTFTGGTWASGSPAIATVSSSGVAYGASAGTALISYSATNVCGTTSVYATVTVNPMPAIPTSITGGSELCLGSTATLSDGIPGGVWSSSNPAVGTINSSTGVVAGLSLGTTTITYTISNSCGSYLTTSDVNIVTLTTAGTVTGPATVCVGNSITLIDTTAGGTWSSSSVAIGTINATSGVLTGMSAGTTTITYTVANVCGSVSSTSDINVLPLPNAGTITGPDTVCIGNSITLSDATLGGTWACTGAFTTISGSTVTGTAPGIDTVHYTVTNTCGSAVVSKAIYSKDCKNHASVNNANFAPQELRLYPSPNDGTFNFIIATGTTETAAVTISSITGQKLKEIAVSTNQEIAMNADLAPGLYVLSAVTNGGLFISKFLVQ